MKYKFKITGLDCPNCAAKLAAIFSREEGIEEAKINFLTEKLTVTSDLTEEALLPILRKLARSFEDSVVIEK